MSPSIVHEQVITNTIRSWLMIIKRLANTNYPSNNMSRLGNDVKHSSRRIKLPKNIKFEHKHVFFTNLSKHIWTEPSQNWQSYYLAFCHNCGWWLLLLFTKEHTRYSPKNTNVIHQRTQTLFTKEHKRYSPKNTNVIHQKTHTLFIKEHKRYSPKNTNAIHQRTQTLFTKEHKRYSSKNTNVIHQRTHTLFIKEHKRYSPKNTNVIHQRTQTCFFKYIKCSFISNVLKTKANKRNYCVMCKYVCRELLTYMCFVLTCSILMRHFKNGFYIVYVCLIIFIIFVVSIQNKSHSDKFPIQYTSANTALRSRLLILI